MAPHLNTVILGIRVHCTTLGGHKHLDCDVSDCESALWCGSSEQHRVPDGALPGTPRIVGYLYVG